MSSNAFVTSTAATPRRLVASALGLVLATSAAHAADVTEPQQKTDKDANGQSAATLEGVKVQSTVVNATSPKFTAPLLDTPRAVTVVPQIVLQTTASTTLAEALRTVPGITFGAGEGGNAIGDRPFIRGFDAGSDIFIDGIRDTGTQSRETFDIEQIDVIKGPSSAYTGRGSAGGSVNIVSKAPKAANFTDVSVGVGTDNYKRGTFDGNYMLNDNTAARLNVMAHKNDAPGRDAVNGKRFGIAPSITFGLKTDTRVTLDYYHLNTNELPDSGIPIDGPYTTGPFAGTGTGRPVNVNRNNYYGLVNRDFRKTKADIGTVRFEHDFANEWTIRNTSRYGKTSNNYIWSNPDDSSGNVPYGYVYRSSKNRIADTRTAVNQTDLTGEFMTGSIKHNFSTGLEFSLEKTAVDGYNVVQPPGPGIAGRNCLASPLFLSDYACTSLYNPNPNDPWLGTYTRRNTPTQNRTSTRSFWAFDTITFNDQWLANLGARYDDYLTKVYVPTAVANAQHLRNQSDFWTWQAGVVFKPVSNGSIYASWGTSANPSGVSNGEGIGDNANLSVATQDLAPQKSKNLEVGTKWDVMDNRLSLTAAVFQSKITNARVSIDATTTALAGTKKVNGIEIGATGNITDKWMVFGGYTHLDPKLTDNGPLAANAAYNGNQFPNTAKNSASLWTTYAILPELTVGGGAFYMDKVFGNVQNTKYVPGYTRFDLMASWQVSKELNLQLNVQNLTNKTYYDKIFTTHYASIAPGRSALISANFHF
ncbi:catecholate siderophore receptor [Luteibacter sp. Sphag1AF]|uniref:TonB-dependent receptor n=1 Tax=Luteibacter sp. Sphag1AF TaxID=2587031 RepID=UPI001620FCC4|nr:TonB-dependent siderophore receptor [Luteibacter sp. Sphag1AF]MBB3227371.1 catecholate siderophore receptor [Luteibacter sp. Sphag1AF]